MPIANDIVPALPSVAVPVLITNDPDEPFVASPVTSVAAPLIPIKPAFGVAIETEPLDDAMPFPDAMFMAPPVPPFACPAFKCTDPPFSRELLCPNDSPPAKSTSPPSPSLILAPMPPLMLTYPPRCSADEVTPADIRTLPPSPDVPVPTLIY